MKIRNLFFLLLLLAGCHEEDIRPVADRTILVYMAADNSLDSYVDNNLNKMLAGFKGQGNFLVYLDAKNKAPELQQIVKEDGGQYEWKVLRTYPEENSASPETLKRVIQEVVQMVPSVSYGMILWSHGMGWLPKSYSFQGASARSAMSERILPQTRYFGEDQQDGSTGNRYYMDIETLAKALPVKLDFLIFDACLMSSIEVMYQLRGTCSYMISSPHEILAEGFPYDKILPYLWGGEKELISVCRTFVDHYDTKSDADYRSASISLVKMAEIENLCAVTKNIFQGRSEEVGNLSVSAVERYYTPNAPAVFYDLTEFVDVFATPEQKALYLAQLERFCIYKQTTDAFFQVPIPKDKFSGISCYIPRKAWAGMNTFYFTHDWPRAVYGL